MWNETQRPGMLIGQGLAANALTFAIVGVVVLVNSVAWGIPLLTGADRAGEPAPLEPAPLTRAAPLATGAVPRPERSPPTPAVDPAPVPLPVLAPADGTAMSPRLAPAEATVKPPKTLYPQPDPAPERLLRPPPAPASDPAPRQPTRTAAAPRPASDDLAFVSPYAPGVRVQPSPKPSAAEADAYQMSSDSPLDRAREIARRASERFEEMRARLSAQESMRTAATDSQLLPFDARRPTASLIGSTSASRSAVAYVRPELERRPLAKLPETAAETTPAVAPATATEVAAAPVTKAAPEASQAVPAAEAAPADASRRAASAPAPSSVPIPGVHHRPVKTASLARGAAAPERPVASASSNSTAGLPTTVAATEAPAPRRAAPSPATARPAVNARRNLRDERRRSQRLARNNARPKKIDGFRPSFHRQLVSANFFGGQH